VTHPGGLPDDRAQILDSADRYARERLAPLAERMDAEEWWPDEAFRALGKEGFLGVTAPAARGGSVFAAHPLRRRGGVEVELRGNAAAGRRWRRRVIRERDEPRTTSRPREV
jgi:alkylation response protein AidB-like acyl-CoA dehydrogenase